MNQGMKKIKTLLLRAGEEFSEDNCSALAGTVAYFGIFSVFPLVLLTLALAGRFLGSEEDVKHQLLEAVAVYLPGALGTVDNLISKLMDSHGLVNGLAIVGLVWAGSQILFYLEHAMNLAWDCPDRPWWKSRLRSIGFLLIAQLLTLGYLFLSVMNNVRKLVGRLPGYGWLSDDALLSFSLWFVSLSLSLMVFVALNRFLPNCEVSWRAALVGGAITTTLFELARSGFQLYLTHYAHYDALYGSIGGLFILVMWAYYGALTTLLGAEIASEVDEVIWERPRPDCRHVRSEVAEDMRRMGIETDI